jgi:hypothetical protein
VHFFFHHNHHFQINPLTASLPCPSSVNQHHQLITTDHNHPFPLFFN